MHDHKPVRRLKMGVGRTDLPFSSSTAFLCYMKHSTRTLLYLGGWLLYLTLDLARHQDSPYWAFGILSSTHQWLTIYLTHVVVLNPLFARKKYGWAILGGLGCVAFFIGFRYLVDEVLMFTLFGIRNYFPGTPFTFFVKDKSLLCDPGCSDWTDLQDY